MMKPKINDKTILLIAAGDPEAMELYIRIFNSYVNALATDELQDRTGKTHYVVNEDRKSYIMLCIIEAALKWGPNK